MSLKIEIIKSTDYNPQLLILNDKEIYPILNFSLRGQYRKLEKSILLDRGILFFIDIFNRPHYLTSQLENSNIEKDKPLLTRDELWEKKLEASDREMIKVGKKPETNPLKRLPPWFWNDVPEEDYPSWMKSE